MTKACEHCGSETNGHSIDCPKLNGQTYYVESGHLLSELINNINKWREKDPTLVLVGGICYVQTEVGTIWCQAFLHDSSVRSSGSNEYDVD